MAKKVSKAAAGGAKKAAKKAVKKRSTKAEKKTAADNASGKPALLSGGNPQIAKGYGDEPVQAYIAAMEGWKSDIGTPPRRADRAIRSRCRQGGEIQFADSTAHFVRATGRTGSSASMCSRHT